MASGAVYWALLVAFKAENGNLMCGTEPNNLLPSTKIFDSAESASIMMMFRASIFVFTCHRISLCDQKKDIWVEWALVELESWIAAEIKLKISLTPHTVIHSFYLLIEISFSGLR